MRRKSKIVGKKSSDSLRARRFAAKSGKDRRNHVSMLVNMLLNCDTWRYSLWGLRHVQKLKIAADIF